VSNQVAADDRPRRVRVYLPLLAAAAAAAVMMAQGGPTGAAAALPIPTTLPVTVPPIPTTVPLVTVPGTPGVTLPPVTSTPGTGGSGSGGQQPGSQPTNPPPTSTNPPPTSAGPAGSPAGSAPGAGFNGQSSSGALSTVAWTLMSTSLGPSSTAFDDIPPEMLALYQEAAPTCRGLSWTVLAGIGKEETNHGRNVAVSSAGAEGVMQFMPATWAMYGIDGNHDGLADSNNPADSVFSAAHYLCVNGAGDPSHLYDAIFAYNHADWYVQAVLGDAVRYAALPIQGTIATVGSYALPVSPQILAADPSVIQRPHHDFPAWDLPVPVGTPVYAVTGGTIIPSNGTCGNGLLLQGGDGFTYQYCHGSQVLVPPGASVIPGQLIMLSGNTGASSGPHLHFGIMRNGQNLCPQPIIQAWFDGVPATPVSAPSTGCFY
jgi:peptidoglycan LD-endopeptidase LytH